MQNDPNKLWAAAAVNISNINMLSLKVSQFFVVNKKSTNVTSLGKPTTYAQR